MTTSAGEWKHSHEMKLPSGNVIILKRIALIDLIAQGRIPDNLSALAVELSTKDRVVLTGDKLKDYEDAVNVLVKASAVKPQVADIADDDHLAVRSIDWVDRVQIYYWCNGVTTLLRPFRSESERTFNAS